MAGVSHFLTVNQANLDYAHIYLKDCIGIFPADVLGGENKSQSAARTVRVQYGSDSVETDIVREKKIFRKRGWVRRFFSANRVAAGHRIMLEQLGPYSYRLSREPCRELKCLSIQQPWADFIINSKKRVENRSRFWRAAQDLLNAGEKVLLGVHASSGLSVWNGLTKVQRQQYAPGWSQEDSSASGAVVGIVPVIQICRWKDLSRDLQEHKFTDSTYDWHWVFGKPRKLLSPFKCPGKVSLFKVHVPHRLLPADLR